MWRLWDLVSSAEFIPIYKKHPDANMYAICQRTKSKLDAVGDAFTIDKRYTDFNKRTAP